MKGVIAKCLKALVIEKFGEDKWKAILEMSGLDAGTIIMSTSDIDDDLVMKIIESTCTVLGITASQAADAFGEYWVCQFAPKIYKTQFAGVNSAKEFLLHMDDVHRKATAEIPNAHPPRFTYHWVDDKTLDMHYSSHRNLIDILVGLIKGVGKHFNTPLDVRKMGNDKVQVVFP